MTTIANDCWDIAFLYWFYVNKNTDKKYNIIF